MAGFDDTKALSTSSTTERLEQLTPETLAQEAGTTATATNSMRALGSNSSLTPKRAIGG
jgi:hypothetical protein